MRVFERQPELIEAVFRQLKLREQGSPNPASAIIGSQDAIFNHQYRDVRLLDQYIARGNQDAEIHDGCLRPVLKAFRDRVAVVLVDKVKLAVFGRATRPY